MMELNIPGYGSLRLSFLVLDYNGTLACDGRLIPAARERLAELSKHLDVHILTADTFGNVTRETSSLQCNVATIGKEHQARAKVDYVRRLGERETVALGNGRNDVMMLQEAALGIAVLQEEGCAVEALLAADIVTTSVVDALDLLLHPLRLTATLRS
ncbi:MAG TPA: ATPase P [Deltaproteobacteria bacterium]|nr:ATPase P [Deltaproteobacteria bacterium]